MLTLTYLLFYNTFKWLWSLDRHLSVDTRIKPVSGIRKCPSSNPGRDVTTAHFFGNHVNSALGPALHVVLPAFLWSMLQLSSTSFLLPWSHLHLHANWPSCSSPLLSVCVQGWKGLQSVTDSGPACFYKLLKVSHKAWSILNCGGRKRICSQSFRFKVNANFCVGSQIHL